MRAIPVNNVAAATARFNVSWRPKASWECAPASRTRPTRATLSRTVYTYTARQAQIEPHFGSEPQIGDAWHAGTLTAHGSWGGTPRSSGMMRKPSGQLIHPHRRAPQGLDEAETPMYSPGFLCKRADGEATVEWSC
jgi:hypothetical protein